ncbi:MAG TPA: hypothetical protein VEW26_13450 [Allosphingosinicella sp.]|nr:hypothetical protein [Allosphingosinicella sp.]
MAYAFPLSAEEAALPPGLAEQAAALAEPGEAVLWAGRGRSGATFAALWPVAVLPALLLGGLLWLWLGVEWRAGTAEVGGLTLRTSGSAYVAAIFGALCLWMLVAILHRVAMAPSTMFALTPGRLVVKSGRRRLAFPITDIHYAVVRGPEGRRALAFKTLRGESGRSGPRPTLFGVANADCAIEVLEGLGIAVRDERPDLEGPESGPAPIRPGETIRWSGRRGFGAAGANRKLMLGAAVPLTLPFIWAVWFAWSKGNSMDTTFAKFSAGGAILLVACIYLGPMAWLVFGHAPAFLGDLYVDIFGRLAVTDRRILFIAPLTGAVHRDIPAERIIEALLVDIDQRGRGYISLTLKGEEEGGKDEIVDLYSVPDPDNALDAIARLIPRQ